MVQMLSQVMAHNGQIGMKMDLATIMVTLLGVIEVRIGLVNTTNTPKTKMHAQHFR